MSFSLPSLDSLAKRVRAAFKTEIPGADAEIWPNNLSVVGKVFAGAIYEVYLRLDWLYTQIFASTATGEHLDRHAYEVGLARKPAGYARGNVQVTGVPGEVVPVGRRFLRADGRAFVTITAAVVGGSGKATLTLQAAEPGATSLTAAGTALTREAVYEELTSDATVGGGGLNDGAEAESDEALRARILDRRRNPPMGGALSDYRIWAESVVGVRRAFAAVYSGGGRMVAVYVLGDGYGTRALPTEAVLAAVRQTIEDERPVCAPFTVTAPVARMIDVRIEGLSPSSAVVRDEVERELKDLFYERAMVVLPGGATSFPVSWISAAIDAAAGEDRHRLVSPADDVALTPGDYPVLGAVEFL